MVLFVCHKCQTTAETGTLDPKNCALDSRWKVFTPDESSGDLATCKLCGNDKEKHIAGEFCNRDGWTLGHWTCCLCARGSDRAAMCGHCQARIEHCRQWRKVNRDVLAFKDINGLRDLDAIQTLVNTAKDHYERCWRHYGPGGAKQPEEPVDQDSLQAYFNSLLITSSAGCAFLASPSGGKYISSLDGVIKARGLGSRRILDLADFRHPQLVGLDVSDNPDLEMLPLKSLALMHSLETLECVNCPRLFSPPEEVASRGGKAVMSFIRGVIRKGQQNSKMPLFLLGDVGAGKTSVIRSLMAGSQSCPYIPPNDRTVGIDVFNWQAMAGAQAGEALLTFTVLDMGGMPLYAATRQLFLARRAVYVVCWAAVLKAREGCEERETNPAEQVRKTLLALQHRIPGASCLLVVTHVDLVERASLEEQIAAVRRVAQQICTPQDGESTLLLDVFNQGESMRVNCVQGGGVRELHDAVCAFAMDRKWYSEMLPENFIRLRTEIEKLRQSGTTRISWKEYAELAKQCGTKDELLKVVTEFLHDTMTLSFFGDVEMASKGSIDSENLLHNTLYIAPRWMADAFRGVVRHEHAALLKYLESDATASVEERLAIQRQLHELKVNGKVSNSLLRFLVPCTQEDNIPADHASDFWGQVKNGTRKEYVRERQMWNVRRPMLKTKRDEEHVVALLRGYRLMAPTQGGAHVLPALIPRLYSAPVDGGAFHPQNCHYWGKFVTLELPPGAFEGLLVALQLHFPESRIGPSSATLYKHGNMAQIRVHTEVRGSGQTVSELMFGTSVHEHYTLVHSQVSAVFALFPGLKMLAMPPRHRRRTQVAHVVWVRALPLEADEDNLPLSASRKGAVDTDSRPSTSSKNKFSVSLSVLPTEHADLDPSLLPSTLSSRPTSQSSARPTTGGSARPTTGGSSGMSRLQSAARGLGKAAAIIADSGAAEAAGLAVRRGGSTGDLEAVHVEEEVGPRKLGDGHDLGDGPPPRWDSKLVDSFALQMHKQARGLKVKVQIPLSRNVVEQLQNFTAPTRVALICLDQHSNLEELGIIMLERQAEGSTIIPVLLPDYSPPEPFPSNAANQTEVISWWPKKMPPLPPGSPYVDLREPGMWQGTIKDVLLPRVWEALERNLGQLPSDAGWGAPEESVVCRDCWSMGIETPARFVREEVMRRIAEWEHEQAPDNARMMFDPQPLCQINCGGEGLRHEHRAAAVVAQCQERNAVPCPRCLTRGELPAHCFAQSLLQGEHTLNADDLRTPSSVDKKRRPESLFCAKCNKDIPSLEIVRPLVFIAYSRGKDASGVAPPQSKAITMRRAPGNVSGTRSPRLERIASEGVSKNAVETGLKKMARAAFVRLERLLGVGCWMEEGADGGVEEGLRGARCIVALLDDDFGAAPTGGMSQAVWELAMALRLGKHVIPVVVVDKWSGGTDSGDWWQAFAEQWDKVGVGSWGEVPWHRCREIEPIFVADDEVDDVGALKEETLPEVAMCGAILSMAHRGVDNLCFQSDYEEDGHAASTATASPQAFRRASLALDEEALLSVSPGSGNRRSQSLGGERSRIFPDSGVRSSFWQRSPFTPHVLEPLPAQPSPKASELLPSLRSGVFSQPSWASRSSRSCSPSPAHGNTRPRTMEGGLRPRALDLGGGRMDATRLLSTAPHEQGGGRSSTAPASHKGTLFSPHKRVQGKVPAYVQDSKQGSFKGILKGGGDGTLPKI